MRRFKSLGRSQLVIIVDIVDDLYFLALLQRVFILHRRVSGLAHLESLERVRAPLLVLRGLDVVVWLHDDVLVRGGLLRALAGSQHYGLGVSV